MPASARRVDFDDGYVVRLQAALHGGEGRLITLSEGGAYIATPLALLPQAQLHVVIEVPELKRTVEVDAVVAWENRGHNRPSPQPEGYGIRFLRVPSASAEAIRWLLRHNERNDPDRTRELSPQEIQQAVARTQESSHSEPTTGPPFRLEPSELQARVPPSTPGVFVLSYEPMLGARIGRADTDLRSALSEFLDRYGYFTIEIVPPRKERFERECELFHRLGGDRGQLDNEEHPLPPPGPQLKCPICVKATAASTASR